MAKLATQLWKTEPIQYLVLWKFPELAAFSWKKSQENDPISSDTFRQLVENSERYRETLGELPEQEIDRLVTQARKEEAEKYKAYRENEEEQRRFNQPLAKADFAYWASASYWSMDEAVALSFGRDPRHVTWETIKPFVNISPFAKSFADRCEIFRRAIVMGQLYNQTIPTVFLAWAERVRLEFPMEMKQQIEKLGLLIADWKTIADQRKDIIDLYEERIRLLDERNSELSKVVSDYNDTAVRAAERVHAALAEKDKEIAELELRADSNSNRSATSRERQSLLRLVIGMAIKGRKYLNEAKDLLPGDIPE